MLQRFSPLEPLAPWQILLVTFQVMGILPEGEVLRSSPGVN